MKYHTLKCQIETIRKAQKSLKTYLLWKDCGMKAKYFKKQELENLIFHLGVIDQITEKYKVRRKASKLKILFIDILKYEYKKKPKKTIVRKLTKYLQQKKNEDQKKRRKREANEKRRLIENIRSQRSTKKI